METLRNHQGCWILVWGVFLLYEVSLHGLLDSLKAETGEKPRQFEPLKPHILTLGVLLDSTLLLDGQVALVAIGTYTSLGWYVSSCILFWEGRIMPCPGSLGSVIVMRFTWDCPWKQYRNFGCWNAAACMLTGARRTDHHVPFYESFMASTPFPCSVRVLVMTYKAL